LIPLVSLKQQAFAAADRFVPSRLQRLWPTLRNHCQSPAELFGEIYREKIWGGGEIDFFSGSGSHNPDVVNPYVQSVRGFLASLGRPLTVVDLGCGDFNIGNRLTDLAATYIACDVVEALIERNRQLFVRNNLKFLRLDAIADPLPQGDVVIVKQVFQHLRNDQIMAILRKMTPFNAWIICEHLPATQDFTPNIDKLAGPDNRLGGNSGIVVTAPPFNVTPRREITLCETPSEGGIVRTLAYQF
jgi:SAM-dependent methyltransferase